MHSVENIILLAKTRHIEELQRLSFSTDFVEIIGLIIHQLQAERGASSLYVASTGQRFAHERADLVAQNQDLEERFIKALQLHLQHNQTAGAKQLTLISWILLGFSELRNFRHQITLLQTQSTKCITVFTRQIGYLVSLIFEITDSSIDSKLSKYLVALYNLVQAKEFAGQERALGSYAFGSGMLLETHQHRLIGLVAQQDRHAELFYQFATNESRQAWDALNASALFARHLSYRHKLADGHPNQPLKTVDAQPWFDLCSEKISEMWQIQCQLVATIHQVLAELTILARADLGNAKSSLAQHKPNDAYPSQLLKQPAHALSMADDDIFSMPVVEAANTYPMASIVHLLQQQSQQIADIEIELSETKKSLNERKTIEKAKGILMKRMHVSEEEAYKVMRSTAMQQNRKIADVAENIVELSQHEKHPSH
jgi:hypothetical protein